MRADAAYGDQSRPVLFKRLLRHLATLDLQFTSLSGVMIVGVSGKRGGNSVVADGETSRNPIVEYCHPVGGGYSRAYVYCANLETDHFARHGCAVWVSAQRGLERNGLAGVGFDVGDGQARIEVDHQASR